MVAVQGEQAAAAPARRSPLPRRSRRSARTTASPAARRCRHAAHRHLPRARRDVHRRPDAVEQAAAGLASAGGRPVAIDVRHHDPCTRRWCRSVCSERIILKNFWTGAHFNGSNESSESERKKTQYFDTGRADAPARSNPAAGRYALELPSRNRRSIRAWCATRRRNGTQRSGILDRQQSRDSAAPAAKATRQPKKTGPVELDARPIALTR